MIKFKKLNNFIDFLLDNPPRVSAQLLKQRIIKTYSLDDFDQEHPIVFVLSTGRVGSETLSSLLSLSTNMVSLHEPSPYLYRLSKSYFQNDLNACETVFDDAFLSLRTSLFEYSLKLGKGYIETSPQATFLAPAIYRVIPNVKFIHLIRHPANVVRSGMRRGWYLNHPGDKTRIIPGKNSKYAKMWTEMSQLSRNIWLWAETNRWISEFFSILPEDRKLVLRSEDVFSNDNLAMKNLYSFISSEIPSDKKVKRILSKRLNKQIQGLFPHYKDWNDIDLCELNAIAHEIMNEFDYSLNPK